MVQQFVADPLTGRLVEDHFGGSLEAQSISTIVEITCETLYGRSARVSDYRKAEQASLDGVSKTDLPLYLLQHSQNRDQYRVGLLSAYSQWSNAQWGTDANVIGSYGQGFQGDQADFERLQSAVAEVGVIRSWDDGQQVFDRLTTISTNLIGGTPISPVGGF
jgi:hypothetical protein